MSFGALYDTVPSSRSRRVAGYPRRGWFECIVRVGLSEFGHEQAASGVKTSCRAPKEFSFVTRTAPAIGPGSPRERTG